MATTLIMIPLDRLAGLLAEAAEIGHEVGVKGTRGDNTFEGIAGKVLFSNNIGPVKVVDGEIAVVDMLDQ